MARLLAGTGPPLEPGHPGRPEGTLPWRPCRRVKKGSCPQALPLFALKFASYRCRSSIRATGGGTSSAHGHIPGSAGTFRRTAVFRACLCRNRPVRAARDHRPRCPPLPEAWPHVRVPVRVPQVFAEPRGPEASPPLRRQAPGRAGPPEQSPAGRIPVPRPERQEQSRRPQPEVPAPAPDGAGPAWDRAAGAHH